MPLQDKIPQMVVAEYERLMEGLSRLGPEDRSKARADFLKQLAAPPAVKTVSLPGWDDVIHIAPRTVLDRERVGAHFRALRSGQPSPLDADELFELDRRQNVKARIRDSTQPEYSQAFGQVLTAIDNVQDLMTTISVVGRIALWPLSKLLGRAVPGIGYVILAADLLNLLSFIGQLALPAYALACTGPKQALASGLPAVIFGRALKSETWKLSHLNPFSRQARAVRKMRAAKLIPSVGNVLEVLQTTDQLFGVGISLGAIVGAIQESAYAVELALRGEPVRVRLPREGRALHALEAGKLEQKSLVDLQTRTGAAQVLQQAPQVLRTQETFTEDEHILVLSAYLAALDLIAADLEGTGWQDVIDLSPFLVLTPPVPESSTAPLLLAEDGAGSDSLIRWALPGAPFAVEAGALIDQLRVDVPRAVRDFLEPRRNTPVGAFYGALVGNVTDRLFWMLEESGDFLKSELTPEFRLLASLAESNRLVNVADPEASILRFWQAGQQAIVAGEGRYLLAPELDALAAAEGMTLIRLVAPPL